jgi:hypothetical protein
VVPVYSPAKKSRPNFSRNLPGKSFRNSLFPSFSTLIRRRDTSQVLQNATGVSFRCGRVERFGVEQETFDE